MVAHRNLPLLVTSILFTSLALVIVASRLVTRFCIIKNHGADDILIAFAMASSIGFLVVVMFQIKYGLGTPFTTIPPNMLPKFFQSLWATIPLYNLTLTLTKLSIVCQYKRIFNTTFVKKLWRYILCILVVYGLWTVLGSTFMCIPVQYFWGVGDGHCMNRLVFWFSNAALNIVTDVIILALPVPLVKGLRLPKRQKIALMLVFTFGIFVCVTSIIRLRSLYIISISTDTSFDGVACAIWSGLEINIAIICSSLATLRPLLGLLFTGMRSANRSNNQYGSRYRKSSSYRMQSLRSNDKAGIEVRHTIEVKDEIAVDGASERNLIDWDGAKNGSSALGHSSA